MPRKMRLALIGAALAVAASGVTVSLSGVASASGATATITTSGPFSNGESITVTGSGFPSRSADPSGLTILECADPGGSPSNLPTDASGCDGSTQSPLPVLTDSSGNFTAHYNVSTLSTANSSNINCSATSDCVLWVGEDYNNDFSDAATQAFTGAFTMTSQPPVFTSGIKSTFTQGPKSSFVVSASGSPAPAITETGALPSGITFTPGNGAATLSGATGSTGNFPITFEANNGTDSPLFQHFTLSVSSNSTFSIVASTLSAATPGSSYVAQLQAIGTFKGPIQWKAIGKLPKGLKLNKATGQIAGTSPIVKKIKSGKYNFTVEVKDHSKPKKVATQAFSITLNP